MLQILHFKDFYNLDQKLLQTKQHKYELLENEFKNYKVTTELKCFQKVQEMEHKV